MFPEDRVHGSLDVGLRGLQMSDGLSREHFAGPSAGPIQKGADSVHPSGVRNFVHLSQERQAHSPDSQQFTVDFLTQVRVVGAS